MAGRGAFGLEEGVLDGACGVFGGDGSRIADDLGNGFEDRRAGGDDLGAGDGGVPVAFVLFVQLAPTKYACFRIKVDERLTAYVLVVDDDSFTILDLNSVRGPDPPLPEHAIHPREPHLLSIFLADPDLDTFGLP